MRGILVCLVVLWSTVAQAAQPAFGAASDLIPMTGNPSTDVSLAVNATDTVYIIVGDMNGNERTITSIVGGAGGTALTQVQDNPSGAGARIAIWVKHNWPTTETATFTITYAAGVTANTEAMAVRFSCSGAGNCTSDASDQNTDTASTHNSAQVGNIDTSANTSLLSACAAPAAFQAETPPTGYTALSEGAGASTAFMAGYKADSATAYTDERGAWTGDGNTRLGTCAIASVTDSGGGGGGAAVPASSLLLLGVGQ